MLVSVSSHAMERPTKKHKASSIGKLKIACALETVKAHNRFLAKSADQLYSLYEIMEKDREYYRIVPGPDGLFKTFKCHVSYEPTREEMVNSPLFPQIMALASKL